LSAAITPERASKVANAREFWVGRLIDQTRRNRLLYYRDLKTGTIDCNEAEPSALQQLLAGQAVPLTRLLPSIDEDTTLARAQEIRRTAMANLEERGLDTLFLAFGFATWTPQDGGRPPLSAILLVHAQLEKRGREGRALTLRLDGEFQVNPVLLFALDREHGLKMLPDSLLVIKDDEPVDPAATYSQLQNLATAVKGFQITPRIVLGNFSFHKMAMVKDLQDNADALANHDLVAAIAGDQPTREKLGSEGLSEEPRTLDEQSPDEEFLVLDADSSQQSAIRRALSLKNGVIHGPPGTGKSQTIANLIAEMAARGRRVLFVAEKRAALEVVMDRLERKGLGYLALDLHGAGITRREVMKRFAESWDVVRQSGPVETDKTHRLFAERRTRLNEHVSRLHTPKAPSGLSVYQLQGMLLGFAAEEQTKVKLRGSDLERIRAEFVSEIRDLLVELGSLESLFLRTDSSPWVNAKINDGNAAQGACDISRKLAEELLPALLAGLSKVEIETGLPVSTTIDDAESRLSVISAMNDALEIFDEKIFHHDLRALRDALLPAKSVFARFWASCFRPKYRRAKHLVSSLR
jgi:hypothetical protein